MAKLAAAIGHQLRLEPRRTDFIAVCSCGYVSAKRRNVAIALEAAEHHQEVVFKAFLASGKPLPIEKLKAIGEALDDTPAAATERERRPAVVA